MNRELAKQLASPIQVGSVPMIGYARESYALCACGALFSQHRTELAISCASSRTSASNSTGSNVAAESDKVSVSRVALGPTKLNLAMRVNHEAMLVAG